MSLTFAQRAEPCRYSFTFDEFASTILATTRLMRPTPVIVTPMLPARMKASGYWPYHLPAHWTIPHGG